MTYNSSLALAVQQRTPYTGPDLMFDESPAASVKPELVDPQFDPAPQISVRRLDVEIAGREPKD